jgi:hypothetical protein
VVVHFQGKAFNSGLFLAYQLTKDLKLGGLIMIE